MIIYLVVSVVDEFQIICTNSEALWYNQCNIQFRSKEQLGEAIAQYMNDASFIVKLKFQQMVSDDLITSEVIYDCYKSFSHDN